MHTNTDYNLNPSKTGDCYDNVHTVLGLISTSNRENRFSWCSSNCDHKKYVTSVLHA